MPEKRGSSSHYGDVILQHTTSAGKFWAYASLSLSLWLFFAALGCLYASGFGRGDHDWSFSHKISLFNLPFSTSDFWFTGAVYLGVCALLGWLFGSNVRKPLIVVLGYVVFLIPASWQVRLVLYGGISVSLMFLFRFVSVPAIKQLFVKGKE